MWQWQPYKTVKDTHTFNPGMLSLSFSDFLGEDLIICMTSLVILMLGIHFCDALLIAANVLPSYGILVTITRETGCCFRSCDQVIM